MNCPYCGREAKWYENRKIYGRNYGKSYMVWLCKPCDAYVGCHNNTKKPLGIMANEELRNCRIQAHAVIDPLWKKGIMTRSEVYQMLSNQFGREIHIGESDIETCEEIIIKLSINKSNQKIMLDENLKIPKEEVKTYPPLPKNIYQAELLAIDLKDATGRYAKEGDKNFVFQFTLLAGTDKEEELRGRNVWENFAQTCLYIGKNGKCTTWQIVEAFLRRELTQEEEATGLTGKLLNSFIGKQIKIFVDHKAGKDGKIYNKITSYISADTKLTSLSDDEKEKAKVKPKEEKKEEKKEKIKGDNYSQPDASNSEEEINVDDIPF